MKTILSLSFCLTHNYMNLFIRLVTKNSNFCIFLMLPLGILPIKKNCGHLLFFGVELRSRRSSVPHEWWQPAKDPDSWWGPPATVSWRGPFLWVSTPSCRATSMRCGPSRLTRPNSNSSPGGTTSPASCGIPCPTAKSGLQTLP